MHIYLPDLARRPAPRYTSYPTALEFSDAVGGEAQAEALAAVPDGAPVSLYLHIPYCRDICWYCGCNTGAIGRPERLHLYVDALEAEMATVAPLLRGRVERVHFGGGSPNALPPALFARVCASTARHFKMAGRESVEWAAELDPRLLDANYAETLAASGIDRVSLGVQCFSPEIQEQIGRIQPFDMVARRVGELRGAGIRHINLDLMYGLPGQGLDDIDDTVTRALSLHPDRIAMFGYAHLPSLLPRQRMIASLILPDAEQRFVQSALAHDLLVEAGYQAIGFDHFALPDDSLALAAREGRLRRNFQGFTDDQADILVGLGASAISQFPGLIVQNEKHVGAWRMRAGNGLLPGVKGVVRSAADRMRGLAIERLLCDGAVDLAAIAALHGRALAEFDQSVAMLADLAAQGLVTIDGARIAITPDGRPYARLAANAFDAYRKPPPGAASRAV